jgi:hypothetical protein
MNKQKRKLIRDLSFIVLSVFIAIVLVKTGFFKNILISTQEIRFLGSFISGILFVSIFTVAPAVVTLAEIAKNNSVITTAILGGLGALIGDLIIFRFVKDRLSADFSYLIKVSKAKRLSSIFKLRLFKWLIQFVGALVVASPLPDELGLAMLGLSKIKTTLFIPLSFLLNSIGILVIGLIAKSI